MAEDGLRFSRLSPETLTEAQKPVYERLAKIGRGGLGGPFDIMLRSPGMAEGMISSYEHFRFHSKLDPRLKEFAILIVAREWTAQFEWYAHKPQAEKAGLAATTIEELRHGRRPTALSEEEAVVYDAVTSLVRDHGISDSVYAKALDLLGEERLVDLVSLVGEYMKVALLLNVGRVGVPAGNDLPLPSLTAEGHAMSDVRCVVDTHAEIGESAIWDDRFHFLYWVDIPGKKLHRFDPSSGHDAVWDMPSDPGAVALRASGGVVLAMRDGFYSFDIVNPTPILLAKLEGEPTTNRLNDGRADPQGRFWSGSVNEVNRDATGALYCLGTDHKISKKIPGITCSNSLCWSPDGKTMYHADSFTWQIKAWDFDAATGEIANPRIFVDIPRDQAFSDGATIDADGCVWAAHWGQGQVKRYDPAGKLMQIVQLPVTNLTSPCFGGRDLTTLYVTSATFRLTDQQRAEQRQAGGLFAIETDVKGLPEHRFAG